MFIEHFVCSKNLLNTAFKKMTLHARRLIYTVNTVYSGLPGTHPADRAVSSIAERGQMQEISGTWNLQDLKRWKRIARKDMLLGLKQLRYFRELLLEGFVSSSCIPAPLPVTVSIYWTNYQTCFSSPKSWWLSPLSSKYKVSFNEHTLINRGEKLEKLQVLRGPMGAFLTSLRMISVLLCWWAKFLGPGIAKSVWQRRGSSKYKRGENQDKKWIRQYRWDEKS